MHADPAVTGEGLATAGVTLGWIGVALSVLALLFLLVGLAVFFSV